MADRCPPKMEIVDDPARPGYRRYRNVRCTSCDAELDPADGVRVDDDGFWEYRQVDGGLWAELSGGYGEFVDQGGVGPLSVVLCTGCAIVLCEALPGVGALLATRLSSFVGHHCVDGELVWEDMSTCERDPDRHGWRTVFYIADRDERWRQVGAELFDDEPSAAAHLAGLRTDPGWAGRRLEVASTPIANLWKRPPARGRDS